jgi:hypothetical protein
MSGSIAEGKTKRHPDKSRGEPGQRPAIRRFVPAKRWILRPDKYDARSYLCAKDLTDCRSTLLSGLDVGGHVSPRMDGVGWRADAEVCHMGEGRSAPMAVIQALSAVPRKRPLQLFVDIADREGGNLPFIRPGLNGEVVPGAAIQASSLRCAPIQRSSLQCGVQRHAGDLRLRPLATQRDAPQGLKVRKRREYVSVEDARCIGDRPCVNLFKKVFTRLFLPNEDHDLRIDRIELFEELDTPSSRHCSSFWVDTRRK